jgi:MFS family permease
MNTESGKVPSNMVTRILTMVFGDYSDVLTPVLRRLFFGNFMSGLGTGMTLSLLLVYLHDIRGFSNTFGGFVLSYMAIVSIIFSGPVGWLVDKYGPKKIIVIGLIFEGSGVALWSIVSNKEEAVFVATMSAVGTLMIWPPQTVMISRASQEEQRQKVFALNFMLFNLAIGFGGIFAALIIQEGNLRSFQTLYILDGLSYIIYLLVILGLKGNFHIPPEVRAQESGGYREVFLDRVFLKIAGGGLIYTIFGYASLQGGLAIFMTQHVGLSPKWLGIVLTANTVTIFLLQGAVLRVISARDKFSVLSWLGWIWALSWAVIAIASLAKGFVAGALIALSQVVFAVGEMIWSPTLPAVANELAPDHLRGRYNAITGMQWNVANVFGPALVGVLIGRGYTNEWLALMIIGSLVPIAIMQSAHRERLRLRAN